MSTSILVVDDEEPIRRNFRALLEDAGHTVHEAVNGADGLETFARERPDLVLTDLRMRSSKDGLELISAIRARDQDIPLVVVSGSGTLQDAIDAIRRGAWDYLIKPVQLAEELLVAIDRNLERGRLLRENRRYRSSLEEMVAARTEALLTAQRENEALQVRLLHARKLESLGLLAGGIAHDFNNVLMLVRGGLDELAAAGPGGTEPALGLIREGLDRATELTRQVFVFAGRAPTNAVPCDLSKLIAGMSSLLRSAVASDVRIETQLDPVPSIAADPVQLRQIVMNLVINGAEAMDGHGVVSIRTSAGDLIGQPEGAVYLVEPTRSGRNVSLTIEDHGSGMSEETLRRIGDPFFTTKARGQGLGLATVIGIVRGLGGTLSVDSGVGRGTRFSIALATVPVPATEQVPRSILSRP